ncbi:hypothetical protein EXIGLDRAFT_53558 [Exidia glandulosa HHB12029]|uniref:Uncharacterized protein n=1 Tax=Exidia glandulosa HHB12029 TaxID=1314781 RepID=A0A166MP23_EXIGL|nr:hypothetical protein EXIGLDRAFT_53558 [Exidia glandulosa HHB12029]
MLLYFSVFALEVTKYFLSTVWRAAVCARLGFCAYTSRGHTSTARATQLSPRVHSQVRPLSTTSVRTLGGNYFEADCGHCRCRYRCCACSSASINTHVPPSPLSVRYAVSVRAVPALFASQAGRTLIVFDDIWGRCVVQSRLTTAVVVTRQHRHSMDDVSGCKSFDKTLYLCVVPLGMLCQPRSEYL